MEVGTLRFPWEYYQQSCLGALRWSPAEFRQSTIWEADRAYEGYLISRGHKKGEEGGLTDEDIDEIKGWWD